MESVFTTGQVAKICRVAPRTVSKWFDSGRLGGYRIPGSNDRRIPQEHLIHFLRKHGMPLRELEDDAMGRILLVGMDPVSRGGLNTLMSSADFTLETAQSGFEAGIRVASLHPDCIVIDFAMGQNDVLTIVRNVRSNSEHAAMILIGLLSDGDNAISLDRTIFNETFRKPFDVGLLAERIRTLVDRKKKEARAH